MASRTGMRRAKLLAAGFGLLNLVLWFGAPTVRAWVDSICARPASPENPYIIYGVQEALVYMDPWYAWHVAFGFFVIGLPVLPWLIQPRPVSADGPSDRAAWFSSWFAISNLLFFECVYLFLYVVGISMRGPNWNFYWPWEPRDNRLVVLNSQNLSEKFWLYWLERDFPDSIWVREAPGLILLQIYFCVGLFVAVLVSKRHPRYRFWGWWPAILVLQVGGLLPLKMLVRWVLNVKYLVAMTEHYINI